MSSSAIPGLERPLADRVLEQLYTSLTHALQELLQEHTATIEAYLAQAQSPAVSGPEAAHAALVQEITHIARFVEILQTDLAALLEHQQVDEKRMPSLSDQPQAATWVTRLWPLR